MTYELSNINLAKLFDNHKKKIILYSDFNVFNYLYKNRIKIPDHIILYPDSSLVYFILKIFNDSKYPKLTSTDLQVEILAQAENRNQRIFFFGDEDKVLKNLENRLRLTYTDIKISGKHNGYVYSTKKVIEEINTSNTDILFVGLGVTRQEKWIIDNFRNINAEFIISVGGWFQYLAGEKKRAPHILRKYHLEWLHKLIIEFPRIWNRYLFGVPQFCYKVLTKKIKIILK